VRNIAVVDAGSSSFILTILLDSTEIIEKVETVKIGSKTVHGKIPDEAIAEAAAVLKKFGSQAREFGIKELCVFGTGIFREAKNGREVLECLLASTGCKGRVITSKEEAELSFRAAVRDFGWNLAVFDVGGISVEYVASKGAEKEIWSKKLGAVVVRERFELVPPFRVRAVKEAVQRLSLELQPAVVPDRVAVVGSAGVFAVAFLEGAERFEWSLHGKKLKEAHLDVVIEKVSRMMPYQIEERGELFKGRGDLFPAGLVILKAAMRSVGLSEITVSAKGFRHELARVLVEGNGLDGLRF